MNEQEYSNSRSAAVAALHPSGLLEQDHLIEEIQHPETTEALYTMLHRVPAPSFSVESLKSGEPPSHTG
ncbi:hypothetical protein OHV05_36755 (plasmid) [Kitasatospora sp. NBC_00070]|uniref:hypothetical protein n=1 Tax=Kitasatospora sp. NBC_00070 TaxID=2975962 RepID=UPI0032566FC9